MKNNSLLTIAAVALIASLIGGFTAGLVGNSTSSTFGASGTRMPNGLSTNSTSPIAGELRTTTLTVDSTSVFTGAPTFSGTVTITGTTTAGRVNTDEFTQGGGKCAITDANGGTYTLTSAELGGCNYLYMTASGAGQEIIALTLPATSTMTLLIPDVGDYREWLIDASDLAAATTTTITLGTGIDMIAVTNAEDLIDGGEYSELRCWRLSDTDVACVTSELINSD